LDLIQVKGQTRPTRIFGLLGDTETASSQEFTGYKARHDELLVAYRAQKWDEAATISKECRGLCSVWGNTGLYDLIDERIAEYRVNSPADNEGNWGGVYVATTK
jgi:adenylate cyclase